MHSENKKAFLSVLRLGIWNQSDSSYEKYDWSFIFSLAEQHGLSAIILDGINCLPEIARPPKEVLLQWIGCTLQSYEYRYNAYKNTISEMAGFYNCHGFKMMVIKGYSVSVRTLGLA